MEIFGEIGHIWPFKFQDVFEKVLLLFKVAQVRRTKSQRLYHQLSIQFWDVELVQ